MEAQIKTRSQNPKVLFEAAMRPLRTYRVVNTLSTADDKFTEIATHNVEVAIKPGGALKVIHAGGANGNSQEREMHEASKDGRIPDAGGKRYKTVDLGRDNRVAYLVIPAEIWVGSREGVQAMRNAIKDITAEAEELSDADF